MKRINILLNISFLILIYSCSSKIKVETVIVSRGLVESTVSTINSGTVEAQKQAELAFGTIGRIAKIHVKVGDIILPGTTIAELENSDLKAVNEEASKEFERAKELYNSGLVSIANLDSAKRAKEVARINLEKTQVKAPFKGMITSLELKIGEFYQTQVTTISKPAIQIIDLEKRIVKGEIDEVDLNKVSNNQKAKVKIPALKNKIIEGVVKKVVPFVSTAKDQDRTSQIELELNATKEDEIKEIPVGASADVEIITEQKNNVLIIPTTYIHGVGGNKFVYFVNGNKLEKKSITIGTGNYDRSEVLTGLRENDQIAKIPDGVDDPLKISVETEVKKWP